MLSSSRQARQCCVHVAAECSALTTICLQVICVNNQTLHLVRNTHRLWEYHTRNFSFCGIMYSACSYSSSYSLIGFVTCSGSTLQCLIYTLVGIVYSCVYVTHVLDAYVNVCVLIYILIPEMFQFYKQKQRSKRGNKTWGKNTRKVNPCAFWRTFGC